MGDGTTTTRTSPVQVGSATTWDKVSDGAFHSVATRTDGTLWAWGLNLDGQLGDGTTATRTSPLQVAAAPAWQVVEAGLDFTVALRST